MATTAKHFMGLLTGTTDGGGSGTLTVAGENGITRLAPNVAILRECRAALRKKRGSWYIRQVAIALRVDHIK